MSLYLFDIDGTLVRSFMREGIKAQDYGLIEVLPGRRAVLDGLQLDGHDVALITNQGGVAFGYQTVREVRDKLCRILAALGLGSGIRTTAGDALCQWPPSAYVSLVHPKAKDPLFLCAVADDWRKPGGGMIRQAMRDYNASPWDTVFVGDMDSDRQAAAAAGVKYVDAAAFFAGTPVNG